MISRLLLILIFTAESLIIRAQIPVGYYNGTSGLTGTTLQQTLHNIIDNHTVISYNNLYSAFGTTDQKPNGKVWDIYSDIPGSTPPYEYSNNSSDQCGNYDSEADCYNREHSWPQSWFNSSTPTNSDLFHLYPTDGYVNNRRSNYPYGEVSTATWTSLNGSKLGNNTTVGYGGTVFEPIDEYKGDLARGYFYLTTRYLGEDSDWSTSEMSNKATLLPWAVCLLLDWHHQDPVSQKETNRNNTIYLLQNNRNPYIDHPEWVDSIFSCLLTTVIKENKNKKSTLVFYPNPTTNLIYVEGLKRGEKLTVFNNQGQIVMEKIGISETVVIDAWAMGKGLYWIKGEENAVKIIVE